MGDAEDIAYSGGREEASRRIGPSGHWGEYGWRPCAAGGSEVWHLTSGTVLMNASTSVRAEQVAYLLEHAYLDGLNAAWRHAKERLRAAIDREFPA
jgi:hypothetical protein